MVPWSLSGPVVGEETQVIGDPVPVKLEEQWTKELNDRLKYEQNRLDTFLSWSFNHHKLDASFIQRLAKAGFYNCGKTMLGISTACFSCGLERSASFWKEGHDPGTVHREKSPHCRFINGQSDNIPIDQTELTVHRAERPNCESIDGHSDNVSIEGEDQNNNRVGSKYLPVLTATSQDFKTKKIHSDAKKPYTKKDQEGDAEKKTIRSSTYLRPSGLQREQDNTPTTSVRKREHLISAFPANNTNESVKVSEAFGQKTVKTAESRSELEDIPNQPKHPKYTLKSDRISTFEKLCEAGFFYTGEKDAVRCFYCDGTMSNWEHAHDPITEHARWYPNCSFIRGVQGQGTQTSSAGILFPVNMAAPAYPVKPTLPANTGEILQSLMRDYQETGRKLHLLMEAVVGSSMEVQPQPHSTNATMSNAQEMISTQRQLQWFQSQGSNFAMMTRADHPQWMMTTIPPTANVQRADDTVMQHKKILLKIASVITSSDELITLGVYLGCDTNDIIRLKNSNPNLKSAAFEILCCFYESVPNVERWFRIIEALEELKKHGIVKELRLEELHSQNLTFGLGL